MKLILLLLLFPFSSFALNQTFLRMPPDRAYMNFVTTKFLGWHRQNFKFPEDSALTRELVSNLDHWLVPGIPPLRQWTMSHSADASGGVTMSLRIFIHPSLRLKELKDAMFVEWNDKGRMCFIHANGAEKFSVWCRNGKDKKLVHEWDEEISEKVEETWPLPFPHQGTKYLNKVKDGKVFEVTFFNVSAHPSRMPEALLRAVYLHTKDALLPLDHVSISREGLMTVHYP